MSQCVSVERLDLAHGICKRDGLLTVVAVEQNIADAATSPAIFTKLRLESLSMTNTHFLQSKVLWTILRKTVYLSRGSCASR